MANAPCRLRLRAPAVRPLCGAVALVLQSAWITGSSMHRARSCAWLKPRRKRRHACSGTGTTKSAPLRTSAPASRINRASGSASERRPSYLNAWMMSRSGPSKLPPARAAVIDALNQRMDRVAAAASQHAGQTQLSVGRSSGVWQAAHVGASVTATIASQTRASRSRASLRQCRPAPHCPRDAPGRRSCGTRG